MSTVAERPSSALPVSRVPLPVLADLLLVASTLLGACGSGESITGPQGASCRAAPPFTVLPVAASELASVSIFGGVDAPGHTLPTDHGGLFLTHEHTPFRSPGDIAVTSLRRVRYSGPVVPPGGEDYAIFFHVCNGLTGWFGHVASLSSTFSPEAVQYGDCRSYSTGVTDVETCEARNLDIKVAAGEELGTGGASAELGLLAIDMGMRDERVTNFYVSPWRFTGENHAVCM